MLLFLVLWSVFAIAIDACAVSRRLTSSNLEEFSLWYARLTSPALWKLALGLGAFVLGANCV